jgi:hypothetical protein
MKNKTVKAVSGTQKKVVTSYHPGPRGDVSPGFYAVIPTAVLYDSSLPQGAKILYALIASLAHKTGYCWAGNAYLAKYCGASERTISYWLVKLHNSGYIIVSFLYYPDSKKIRERRIRLPPPVVKVVDKIPLPDPDDPGDPETLNDAISGVAASCNTQDLAPVQNSPEIHQNDTIYGVAASCNTQDLAPPQKQAEMPEIGQNYAICGVATNCNTQDLVLQPVAIPSVAMDCGDININSYIDTAAAAAPPLGEEAQPPPEGAAAASPPPRGDNAAPPGDNARQPPGGFSDLKTALAALDATLVFDNAFYPQAYRRLEEKKLPPAFLSWLYEQCLLKKPASLRGMFYKLFFAPDMAESFKALYKPPPEAVSLPCPACGASHDPGDSECPACGLKNHAQDSEIRFHRHLLSLPPEQQRRYRESVDRILSAYSGDFKTQKRLFDALHKDFGFPP